MTGGCAQSVHGPACPDLGACPTSGAPVRAQSVHVGPVVRHVAWCPSTRWPSPSGPCTCPELAETVDRIAARGRDAQPVHAVTGGSLDGRGITTGPNAQSVHASTGANGPQAAPSGPQTTQPAPTDPEANPVHAPTVWRLSARAARVLADILARPAAYGRPVPVDGAPTAGWWAPSLDYLPAPDTLPPPLAWQALDRTALPALAELARDLVAVDVVLDADRPDLLPGARIAGEELAPRPETPAERAERRLADLTAVVARLPEWDRPADGSQPAAPSAPTDRRRDPEPAPTDHRQTGRGPRGACPDRCADGMCRAGCYEPTPEERTADALADPRTPRPLADRLRSGARVIGDPPSAPRSAADDRPGRLTPGKTPRARLAHEAPAPEPLHAEPLTVADVIDAQLRRAFAEHGARDPFDPAQRAPFARGAFRTPELPDLAELADRVREAGTWTVPRYAHLDAWRADLPDVGPLPRLTSFVDAALAEYDRDHGRALTVHRNPFDPGPWYRADKVRPAGCAEFATPGPCYVCPPGPCTREAPQDVPAGPWQASAPTLPGGAPYGAHTGPDGRPVCNLARAHCLPGCTAAIGGRTCARWPDKAPLDPPSPHAVPARDETAGHPVDPAQEAPPVDHDDDSADCAACQAELPQDEPQEAAEEAPPVRVTVTGRGALAATFRPPSPEQVARDAAARAAQEPQERPDAITWSTWQDPDSGAHIVRAEVPQRALLTAPGGDVWRLLRDHLPDRPEDATQEVLTVARLADAFGVPRAAVGLPQEAPSGRAHACDGCGDRLPSDRPCVAPSGEHTPRPLPLPVTVDERMPPGAALVGPRGIEDPARGVRIGWPTAPLHELPDEPDPWGPDLDPIPDGWRVHWRNGAPFAAPGDTPPPPDRGTYLAAPWRRTTRAAVHAWAQREPYPGPATEDDERTPAEVRRDEWLAQDEAVDAAEPAEEHDVVLQAAPCPQDDADDCPDPVGPCEACDDPGGNTRGVPIDVHVTDAADAPISDLTIVGRLVTGEQAARIRIGTGRLFFASHPGPVDVDPPAPGGEGNPWRDVGELIDGATFGADLTPAPEWSEPAPVRWPDQRTVTVSFHHTATPGRRLQRLLWGGALPDEREAARVRAKSREALRALTRGAARARRGLSPRGAR